MVSDRIAWAFNSSGLLELWHLLYPRLLAGFGVLVYFIKFGLGEFQSDIWLFGLISSFLSIGQR